MAERVLIIDDDVRLSAMLADYLAEGGLVVSRANDGESGLQALSREPPDIVVLDLMLPGIDGVGDLPPHPRTPRRPHPDADGEGG